MKLLPLACLTAGLLLTGCASHIKLAKGDRPAVVQEDWQRKEIWVWDSTRIFRIDDVEFGYMRYDKEARFSIDPGRHRIRVWYFGNRGDAQGLLWQTDPVEIEAELKPDTNYLVGGDYDEASVRFKLIEQPGGTVVAESIAAPIIRRPYPRDQSMTPVFVPIIIRNK
jgi:hypothetical protein